MKRPAFLVVNYDIMRHHGVGPFPSYHHYKALLQPVGLLELCCLVQMGYTENAVAWPCMRMQVFVVMHAHARSSQSRTAWSHLRKDS